MCQNIDIVPEIPPQTVEDSRGITGALEICFQEVLPNKLKPHIQKVHFKRDQTYVKDLTSFIGQLKELSYVQKVLDFEHL